MQTNSSSLLEKLIDKNNKILAIGAHCDDIELFCGRLILARGGENTFGLFTATGDIGPIFPKTILRILQGRYKARKKKIRINDCNG